MITNVTPIRPGISTLLTTAIAETVRGAFREAFNAVLAAAAREPYTSGTIDELVSAFLAACYREARSLEDRWAGQQGGRLS